jgi:PAS domain S-box-containing protein
LKFALSGIACNLRRSTVLVLLGATLGSSVAAWGQSLSLAPEERAWLDEHPVIRVGCDPSFPPIEYFDDAGQHRGIAADYLALLGERLGIRFEVKRFGAWSEAVEAAREREIDMWSEAVATPQREEYMRFTAPYIRVPCVILTTTGGGESLTLEGLRGKRVAVVEGYWWFDVLSEDHPEIELVSTPDIPAALQMTSFKIVDAMVTDLATTSHFIEKLGLSNLRVAGQTSYSMDLAMAVRSDWPEFHGLLEKALADIPKVTRDEIWRRWVLLERRALFQRREFWTAVIVTASTAALLAVLVLVWIRILRRQVAQRTAELHEELERRHEAERELREHRDHLDELVQLRTAELTTINELALKLSRAVEQSPATVVITDATGSIEYVNPKFTEITGYTDQEAYGQNPRVLKSGEHPPEFYKELWDTISSGHEWRGEFCNRRKDGQLYWEAASISPVRNDAGKITHYVAVKEDVTARKQAEQELREARAAADAANRAKSAFLANMSHEIRTPMNGIIGMTDLALDTELTPEQRDYLNTVKTSADALLTLINDILDFSKIEAGKLELDPIDFALRDSLADMLNALANRAHSKGLELAYEVLPEVRDALIGDVYRLRQVIVNLVGNAIKFTSSGEILVRVEQDERTDERVTLHVSVSDTGIGIPASKLESIFTPFEQADTSTTRKYGGTGLGLAISVQLVELMGGRIWAESEEGKGTTFHFTAQFDIGTPAPAEDVERRRELLDGLPVLVVDDNATNRRILEAMLRNWQMQPRSTEGGADALAEMDRADAAGQPFKLVLSDVNMPEMDGFMLYERTRESPRHKGTPFILLTSAARPGDVARCREIGVSAHLIKPVKQSILMNAIVGAVAGKAVAAREADKSPSAAAAPAAERALQILLAEDNAVNQKFAVRAIEKAGHAVVVASNGREALERWQQDAFDVILMDIQMPEMDGFEATARIRELEQANEAGPHIPIIAMTANAMKGDKERCLEAGMDGYVSKPVKRQTLFAEIDRVLGVE